MEQRYGSKSNTRRAYELIGAGSFAILTMVEVLVFVNITTPLPPVHPRTISINTRNGLDRQPQRRPATTNSRPTAIPRPVPTTETPVQIEPTVTPTLIHPEAGVSRGLYIPVDHLSTTTTNTLNGAKP